MDESNPADRSERLDEMNNAKKRLSMPEIL